MPFMPTKLPGVIIFEPKVFGDSRGYFFESYNADVFKQAGIDAVFVQDNESRSNYGVLRGLHFQRAPHAQAKLVRVAQGKVLDVVVDIRKDSPQCGQWISVELSAENRRQLFVPRGYAHGFVSLSNEVVLLYKCDNFYHPPSEAGIRYDDATLNIDWQIPRLDISVSAKDAALPVWLLLQQAMHR
ncbi:MAG: dTDP-4-dehydrorhamnose 3,5-epimerase [Elusimicrobia bacterium]|nr:dTDP-4-dehydrorhamnose 3,5-epimerase [Elusimicrobiota bacterium]